MTTLPAGEKWDHDLQEDSGDNRPVLVQPLVSVVVLTYNHGPYLADTIDGVLIQRTAFPIELIISDDCSTDNTYEVAKSHQREHPDLIRLLRPPSNVGVHENLKRSFLACKGKYIAYCEGDDYWTDPDKLQKQANFLETHPDYVICFHNSQPFNEGGDLSFDFGGARRDLSANELQLATPIFTLTTCFRNVIKNWPPEFAVARVADRFLWSLLGQYGQGKYLPDIQPARYRVHAGGIFSTASNRKRLIMNLSTQTALFQYHTRMGHEAIAETFLLQTLRTSAALLGPGRFLLALSRLGVRFLRNRIEGLKRTIGMARKES